MEDYLDSSKSKSRNYSSEKNRELIDDFSRIRQETRTSSDSGELVQRHMREKAVMSRRRKWTGGGLITFGSTMLMGSCPIYSFGFIGPEPVLAGLAMIALGSGLLAWKPKLKDTNEALLAAARNDNYLTVPRLALEMDISFDKAEKILQELVRTGIAEIDLDRKRDDDSLVYKIRGL